MEQLNEKSGINLSTLKKYETDNRNHKLEQLSKIAEALEVSVFEFFRHRGKIRKRYYISC